MKQNKVEKKTKHDFMRFAWCYGSAEGLKLSVVGKDNSVSIYDWRNMSTPVGSLGVKTSEVTVAEWDRSDSVLFVAGGE